MLAVRADFPGFPAPIVAGVVALLALAGCDGTVQAPAGKVTAKTPATAPAAVIPKRSPPVSPETLQRAFKAVFGAASPLVEEETEAGFEGETEAKKLIWLGDTAILITTTTYKDASHGTEGKLGIYYLKAAGAGFTVTGKWPDAVLGNGFGGPADFWVIARRFGPLPVLYSEAGFMGQGYTCTWFELTELAPDEPKSLASVPIYYDDTGALEEGGIVIEGKITTIVPGKSFTVHYTGARTFTETWVRHGDDYVLRGKTRMKEC